MNAFNVFGMTLPAVVSGTSLGFYILLGVAVVAGIGVLLRVAWPFKGLGYGLIAGAIVIGLIIATGPAKP